MSTKKKRLWWLSQALTEFLNGAISGIPGGLVAGSGAVTSTDSMNAEVLSKAAIFWALLAMAGNGLKRVVLWHDRNQIPNVFFGDEPDEPPVPPIPKRDPEMFAKIPELPAVSATPIAT